MDKIQAVNKQYYEENAVRWADEKTHSFYAEESFRVFEAILSPEDRILDVGCGYGRDVPLFLGIGRKLIYEGLDISQKFINIASSRYPQLKFRVGNILDLDSLPKGFDGFWAASSLQHIPEANWPRMLDNLESIIKPGGIGYFTLPEDRPNPASAEDPRHFTIISDQETKEIFDKRGWKLLHTGELSNTRQTTSWRWYIYQLPE